MKYSIEGTWNIAKFNLFDDCWSKDQMDDMGSVIRLTNLAVQGIKTLRGVLFLVDVQKRGVVKVQGQQSFYDATAGIDDFTYSKASILNPFNFPTNPAFNNNALKGRLDNNAKAFKDLKDKVKDLGDEFQSLSGKVVSADGPPISKSRAFTIGGILTAEGVGGLLSTVTAIVRATQQECKTEYKHEYIATGNILLPGTGILSSCHVNQTTTKVVQIMDNLDIAHLTCTFGSTLIIQKTYSTPMDSFIDFVKNLHLVMNMVLPALSLNTLKTLSNNTNINDNFNSTNIIQNRLDNGSWAYSDDNITYSNAADVCIIGDTENQISSILSCLLTGQS